MIALGLQEFTGLSYEGWTEGLRLIYTSEEMFWPTLSSSVCCACKTVFLLFFLVCWKEFAAMKFQVHWRFLVVGEKLFAVLWTNALALLNGLLITCLSLPSTASTVGWDPLKEPFYSQKSLQFVSCGQTNWSKLKPYLNSLFNTHIKWDLYWWLNKSTGTHSYTKPLKNLISSVCPVSPWIRDGRFHFCKKK